MAQKIYPEQLLRLQEEHKRAIKDTSDQIEQWLKFKSDYEALKTRLETLPDQVTHDVMVPFGKMAFMPGQLVHTNEILVLLGDNWFVERSAKQASEIVDRRIEAVDKQLKELNKQMQLLEPRKQFTLELQELSKEGGEMVDIREKYDEEKEKQWKDTHKKHVKEYRSRLKKEEERQQIRQQPEQTGSSGLTDEELWARLDQLESIESERKEIQRIGTHAEKRLEGYKFPDFHHNRQTVEDNYPDSDQSNSHDEEESSYTASDELDSDDYDDDDVKQEEEEQLESKGTLITFSHSQNTEMGQSAGSTDQTTTMSGPGDIYAKYVDCVKAQTSGILKKSPSEQRKKVKHKTKKTVVSFDTGSEDERDVKQNTAVQQSSLEPAFSGTVVEKSVLGKNTQELPPKSNQAAPQKPVSKFKAMSANQNRDKIESVSQLTNQTDSSNIKPVSKFKAQRQMTRR
ncbi:unconventional prefoldin RPB5 interactor-like [Ruditapes philippinarum]|uniref:unconventional prefoldin RPB5 interactor-like n=1 Tax=Ruditapes philippinarum TaxID=129788 RepID=UPI00295ACC47|nr:unconventional prefoldin RPB5 interactor-like [Ruditapes philippinarum]